jgi:hypothetical protein
MKRLSFLFLVVFRVQAFAQRAGSDASSATENYLKFEH